MLNSTISSLDQKILLETDSFLRDAVVRRLKKGRKPALGFSGGLDSSILAYYLKENTEVSLYYAGIEGNDEYLEAVKVADFLGLPVNVEFYREDDVEDVLDLVLGLIFDDNPVNVGVAVPLYWVVKKASMDGHTEFFSGGGADELFGGYHRYLKQSSTDAQKQMIHDVRNAYELNFGRDMKICKHFNVNLELPYSDEKLIDYVLPLPVSYKLSEDPSAPRKILLRALAKKLGFPETLVYKRKKAFQYSTGVNKVLQRMAKKNGMRLREYLRMRFDKVKKEMSGK